MASGFPGSIDSFTNPLTTSALNSPSHAGQHQDLNDAVNKIENYMGLVKVIPTSVSGTGVTLAANGTVSFSSSTSITINGCFTSQYRDYFLTVTGTSNSGTAADLTVNYAVGGVSNTTANYYSNIMYNTHAGGPFRYYTGGQTVGYCGQTASPAFTNSINIWGPQIAFTTSMSTLGNGFGSSTATVGQWFVNFNATTQFDGVIFGASGNALTGTIRIYGYRN